MRGLGPYDLVKEQKSSTELKAVFKTAKDHIFDVLRLPEVVRSLAIRCVVLLGSKALASFSAAFGLDKPKHPNIAASLSLVPAPAGQSLR